MTEKQRRFCDEYLIDCNATRAYKAAYPSVKNDEVAKAAASRMLTNVNVKAYISEQLEEIHSKKIASAAEVAEYLTSVLRGESMSSEVVLEFTGASKSKARILEKPPSEKDRLKAAELLGKRYGLFTEKVDINTDSVVQIIDDIPGGSIWNESSV